jgi:outer membrane protein assembly factor BamA
MSVIRGLVCIGLLFGAAFSLRGQMHGGLDDSKLVVQDVVIEGNKVTKRNIILRELVFSIGDTIAKMELIPALERSRENLLNLSIFNFVKMDASHLPDNRIDVLISVQERWYIWPTPIFEHAGRNLSSFIEERDWKRLNYGLWLKWNNFRGRNELLSARVRLGYKEQYLLEYSKPNIGSSERHKIAVGASYSRQHQVNYRTIDNGPVYFRKFPAYALTLGSGYLAYTYRKELYDAHRLRLSYNYEQINDSVALLNPEYMGEGRTHQGYFKIDYVYNFDIRDSKVYPLEGMAFKLKMQQFGLGIVNDFPYTNFEIEGSSFLHRKATPWLYLANATEIKYSLKKDLPFVYQKALGYNEYMTSYEYFIIDGSDYLISKFISKFQLLKPTAFNIPYIKAGQFSKVHLAIYLNLLADVGYVYNRYPDPSNYMDNEWQYSAGIGLDFVTYYDRVFRLEYSINRYGFRGFFFHVETPFFRW